MIGQMHADQVSMMVDEDGAVRLVIRITPGSRYYARSIVNEIRSAGKEVSIRFDWRKHRRTLDQNALMWKLLTIYAEAQGGGRRGSIQPEDVYIRMLSKYGIAEFVMTVPEAEDTLRNVFRIVLKVDTRMYNGKEMVIFKCYYGSSTYDTKAMSQLIDGIFDELAEIGVDAGTSKEILMYQEQWNTYKAGGNHDQQSGTCGTDHCRPGA